MSEQITLHKALVTIKKMKQLLQEQQNKNYDPVAIVGMSCRFPDTIGKDAYWQMLMQKKNIISKIPEERWQLLKNTHEIDLRSHDHPYWGGYLSKISAFDAYFFGISPREALRMDPQHRLLLEVAYEAMEDAGLTVETLAGSNTGVFSSLYVSQLAHMQRMDNEMDALYLPTGNAISIAANRISYLFDLRGPSIIIDSACSSSMASLHLACLNIQSRSCETALVCGAKLNLLPYVNFVLTKAKMLSPDGQCKTFDADANGYVQGEGVGVIVLKSLKKALQDKDRIYAVIMGSAVNQDGKTNGLTAPNGLQQENLLKTAYQSAHVQPQEISYIECHGTGTFLGDPIEIQALGSVVGKNRSKDQPCWIGSVKTNIGHLEPAAGVASIIKAALTVYNKTIPPHLNFHNPNPHITFDKYQFKVPTQSQELPKYGEHRIMGVSGFGFGGTNAHIVLRDLSESEQVIPADFNEKHDEIFTLSAKDSNSLKELITKWCDYLTVHPDVNLSQVCYNLHVKRSHYPYRLAIITSSLEDLTQTLKQVQKNYKPDNTRIFLSLDQIKTDFSKKALNDFTSVNLKSIAEQYVAQTTIDWKEFEKNRSYVFMDLPTYAWQHKDYWPPLGAPETKHEEYDSYPLMGKMLSSPLDKIQFEFHIDTQRIPDLQDTYNIMHAGYYLEILSFVVNQLSAQSSFTIEDHEFLSPLIVPNDTKMMVQLVLEKTAETGYQFYFYSNTKGQKNWVIHAKGHLQLTATNASKMDSIEKIKKRCSIAENADKLYEKILSMGMPAGDSIRWTQRYWRNNEEILCEFKQPKFMDKNALFKLKIHPSIFDASIQPIFKLLPADLTKPYIASSAKRVKFFGIQEGQLYLWGHLKEINPSGEKMLGHLCLINENNQVIAEFEDIALTQLDNKIQIEEIMKAKEIHEQIDLTALPPSERKQYIISFLVEQIANIFSMPKQDIEINRSLKDMGIDSLMALVLMRTLELGLNTTYPMQSLLEGPTIEELADFVMGGHITKTEPTTEKKPNVWINYRKSTNADMRLFCFPYGGGGASIYREWQKEISDKIEICPIQLPGRESRMNEKPIAKLDVLLHMLVDNLKFEFDVPFAFFGHSFGSLIAFELARLLRKRGLSTPVHLFASAFPDPRTPTKSLDNLLKQLSTINITLNDIETSAAIDLLSEDQLTKLSDIFNENGIADYGDHLMNREIIKVLLPIFIGDMSIVKSYQYHDEAPLNLPISVFLGKRDTWVDHEDHIRWKEHTAVNCSIHEFDSGHLFIKDKLIRKEVLQIITDALLTKVKIQS